MIDDNTAGKASIWKTARAELAGLLGSGGINVCYEAVDRHAAIDPDRVALRFLMRETTRDLTYGELRVLTSRFANVLDTLGIQRNDRVATLLTSTPELYVAALGSLKFGAVFTPLFSSYGPEPVRARLTLGRCRVLITSGAVYKRNVVGIRDALPNLEYVILVDDQPHAGSHGAHQYRSLMRKAGDQYPIADTSSDDPALLHFTSGTTGTPKGVLHVHEAVVAHYMTAKRILDLRPGDVYWCTADPGWVTGTSYGIIGPLTTGVTVIVDSNGFDTARWMSVLESQRVNVWYTAPTALRMLMLADAGTWKSDPDTLRLIASVGEPLEAPVVEWSKQIFGIPIHDTWWQTETGAIMIANRPGLDVKPGSMGKPVPGIEAAVVHRGDNGIHLVEEPDETGELALRRGWPSMFRAYLEAEALYESCFVDDWYLTGDLVRRDAQGYYWFVARTDDVIKSAGHLIGPAEVEAVLEEHPAVAEAAVVGEPDPVAHEVVKAFVTVRSPYTPSLDLARELRAHARKRLGPVVAPRDIAFRTTLPRSFSGKISRRMLRLEEHDRIPDS